mmetsp:Transcript_3609/g.11731  ORF Transcript_3609/g.11731 Transcript_3609/m.11731 type:complete len:200 (+) Transcript_3609:721-1320(+)
MRWRPRPRSSRTARVTSCRMHRGWPCTASPAWWPTGRRRCRFHQRDDGGTARHSASKHTHRNLGARCGGLTLRHEVHLRVQNAGRRQPRQGQFAATKDSRRFALPDGAHCNPHNAAGSIVDDETSLSERVTTRRHKDAAVGRRAGSGNAPGRRPKPRLLCPKDSYHASGRNGLAGANGRTEQGELQPRAIDGTALQGTR